MYPCKADFFHEGKTALPPIQLILKVTAKWICVGSRVETSREGENLVRDKANVHRLSKLLGEPPQGQNSSVVPPGAVYDLLQ